MPSNEWAGLDGITWSESYGVRSPQPVSGDADPPKPTQFELPARVYSLLTGILAALAFIGALLMLR